MARLRDKDAAARALARTLIAARERLGLSIRAFGAKSGIPSSTVAALEGGREPKWLTLRRYLETVPGLSASQLLPSPASHAPAASPAMMASVAECLGLVADEVRLSVRVGRESRRQVLEILGLRALWSEEPAPEHLLGLMRTACVASRAFVRSLQPVSPKRRLVRLQDGGVTHEFRVLSHGPLPAISYRRTSTEISSATHLTFATGTCVRRLRLQVELPASTAATAAHGIAWLVTRPPKGIDEDRHEDPGFTDDLHPEGLEPSIEREGRKLLLAVDDLLPGLSYRLRWTREAPRSATRARRVVRPRSVGPLIRGVRESAGLSQRELARQMGVSHVTLLEAERGRDPRASTLRALLQALPGVAPQRLLPMTSPPGDLSPEERWSYFRDLHQAEAALTEHDARLDRDGTWNTDIRWVDFRDLAREGGRARIRTRQGNQVFSTKPYLSSIITTALESDQEEVTRRVLPGEGVAFATEVTISRRLARRGITITERSIQPVAVRMTAVRARPHHGGAAGPYVAGKGLSLSTPSRRLTSTLRFPPHYTPAAVRAVAWAQGRPPAEFGGTGALDRLHPGKWTLEHDAVAGTLTLAVDLPLCGVHYGLGWTFPERFDDESP